MKLLLAVAFVGCTVAAQAGTLDYQFEPTGLIGGLYYYDVSVTVSGDDTSGLAGFAFHVRGLPNGLNSQVGFTPVRLRTVDNDEITHGFGSLSNTNIGQNLRAIGATQFLQQAPIFGIGIAPQFYDGPNADLSFDVPAVLGTLRSPIRLTQANIVVGGTLFTLAKSADRVLPLAAMTYTYTVGLAVPEPSAIAIAGLSLLCLMGTVRVRLVKSIT